MLDGEGADQVEIGLVKASEYECESGNSILSVILLGKKNIKPIEMRSPETITAKFRDLSTLILLAPWYLISTGVGLERVRVVRDAISVRLYKGGSLIKSYSIDVISQLCGGGYCLYDYYCPNSHYACYAYEPEKPEQWYLVEAGDLSTNVIPSCLLALDSTDMLSADVLASSCMYDATPYLYLPAGTKLVAYVGLSAPLIFTGVIGWYKWITPFPRPDLVPDEEGDSLYCGRVSIPIS